MFVLCSVTNQLSPQSHLSIDKLHIEIDSTILSRCHLVSMNTLTFIVYIHSCLGCSTYYSNIILMLGTGCDLVSTQYNFIHMLSPSRMTTLTLLQDLSRIYNMILYDFLYTKPYWSTNVQLLLVYSKSVISTFSSIPYFIKSGRSYI